MGKGDVLEKKAMPEEPEYKCQSKAVGTLATTCPSKKSDDPKKILKAIFTNVEGIEISSITTEEKIILEIHSVNMSGETVIIDNPFITLNFKLNNKIITDEVVIKLKINSDIKKLEFNVFDNKDIAKNAEPKQDKNEKKSEEKKLGHFYSKDGDYLKFEEGSEDVFVDDVKLKEDHESLQKLAAVAYGEASTSDIYEEIAGIASVIFRQVTERKSSIKVLLSGSSTYAFAASDGNSRVKVFNNTKPADRNSEIGMKIAVKAAINSILLGTDYSNGAYFWDGIDIKTNYNNHPKIKAGFHFLSESHNIFKLVDSDVDVTTWWYDKDLKPTKIKGNYTYTYESTASQGGTIFSKYNAVFLKATGNKKYK